MLVFDFLTLGSVAFLTSRNLRIAFRMTPCSSSNRRSISTRRNAVLCCHRVNSVGANRGMRTRIVIDLALTLPILCWLIHVFTRHVLWQDTELYH